MGNIMKAETPIYFPGLYAHGSSDNIIRKLKTVGSDHEYYIPKPIELNVDWLLAFNWIKAFAEPTIYKYYLQKAILAIDIEKKMLYIDRPNSRIPIWEVNYVHQMQHAITFFSRAVPDLTEEAKINLKNKFNYKFL